MMAVSSKSFSTNSTKNEFINCFKLSNETECFSDLFKIPTELRGSISHAMSDHDVKMPFPLDEHDGSRINRIKLRRVFSRLLKGVFSRSSSTRKKKKQKKVGEETSPCGDDRSTKIQKTFKFKKAPPISSASGSGSGENTPFDGSLSNSSSLFTSSSLSSNSRSGSERKTTDLDDESNMMKTKSTSLKKKYGDYNYNLGLYFLLICLAGLVFCGKVFAICCTAICLLFFPSRRLQVNHVDFPLDFDFEPAHQEHRRNVIMKGVTYNSRSVS